MGPLPTDDAGEYWKAFSEAGDEIAENMRAVIATLRAENEALRAQFASIRDETERGDEINHMADAIDAARYAHPQHPRERDRSFAEADKGDREYAFRLARAAWTAIRALQTKEQSNG